MDVRRHRTALLWVLAGLCFGFGTYIGWTINAQVGAGLWLVAAVLAFLPFLAHRTR